MNALLKILGLQYSVKYETDEERNKLRYGKIMIMADQVRTYLAFLSDFSPPLPFRTRMALTSRGW